ncbi:MAG: hypothetical protein SXV54_02370 [Chloroflexota bacterium]|nr:hypothetical protein [Chloroflexota bacterium]
MRPQSARYSSTGAGKKIKRQTEEKPEETDVASKRSQISFLVNRVLIVLAIAAILGGLFFDQWQIVLRNAILL